MSSSGTTTSASGTLKSAMPTTVPAEASGDVRVAGAEGVGEPAFIKRGDDLGDAVGHPHLGVKAEDTRDLVERHLVVARILRALHERHRAAVGLRANELHEVSLAIVLSGPAHVEHLACDVLTRCLEHQPQRTCRIADVDIRSPELLAEDLQ